MIVDYGWKAPSWSGAETYPVLYENYGDLLFACAMLEEGLPGARQRLQMLRSNGQDVPFDLSHELQGELERLTAQSPVVLSRAQDLLAIERMYVEAWTTSEDTTREIHEQVLTLLRLNCVPEARRHKAIALANDPERLVRWVRRHLPGELRVPGSEEILEEISALLREHRTARQVLDAAPPVEQSDGEFEALTTVALDLCRDVYNVIPVRLRLVPRAAPDEPDAGHFPLPYEALCTVRHVVRVLAETDARLKYGTPSPLGRLRTSMITKRNHLVHVLERVAHAAAERASYTAACQLHAQLQSLCGRIATHFGLVIPAHLRDGRDMGTWLLAELVERQEDAARSACARLTTLLSTPAAPPQPPERQLPSKEDHLVLRELEKELFRARNLDYAPDE